VQYYKIRLFKKIMSRFIEVCSCGIWICIINDISVGSTGRQLIHIFYIYSSSLLIHYERASVCSSLWLECTTCESSSATRERKLFRKWSFLIINGGVIPRIKVAALDLLCANWYIPDTHVLSWPLLLTYCQSST